MNEDELREKFPRLFKEKVRCGVGHPDGWDSIVEDLCKDLETMLIDFENQGKDHSDIYVTQTKSKFGD